QRPDGVEERRELGFEEARLRRFASEVHLDEDDEGLAPVLRSEREAPRHVEGIEALDDVGDRRGALRLVRLKRADEVAGRSGGKLPQRPPGLVDAVLARPAASPGPGRAAPPERV